MNKVLPGRYQHYKGNEYTVLGVSRHSETHEELVVYRQEYGDRGLWVRPLAMFLESVMVNGQSVPRFQRLDTEGQHTTGDGNLFHDLPTNLPDELVETIITAGQVRIERIVSQGHSSPDGFWYDQDQHEWVAVLQGAARLRFEDGIVEMNRGDFIHIRAHQRHRVDWTSPDGPTIWLAVHYGG